MLSFYATSNSITTTDDLDEGATNLYYTAERVDDQVNTLLTAGTNITLTYDDGVGTLTIDAAGGGGTDTDTRENIIGTAGSDGDLAYATDLNTFYLSYNSEWFFNSIPFVKEEVTGVNIGVQQTTPTRYNALYVTDLGVYNSELGGCKFVNTDKTDTGLLRSVEFSSGVVQPQIYSDGAWRALLVGIELDETTGGSLVFTPFGSEQTIQVHTGNSTQLGLNGIPLVQNYERDIGANPAQRITSGKFFDGTGYIDW